jgi:hypothetical protein
MKSLWIPVGLALTLVASAAAAPAQATGCLRGAAIGGVAGHYAGHHGLVGAGVGCVIGRHEAHKRSRELDLLRKSGEFPVSNEELDETATTVYEGV